MAFPYFCDINIGSSYGSDAYNVYFELSNVRQDKTNNKTTVNVALKVKVLSGGGYSYSSSGGLYANVNGTQIANGGGFDWRWSVGSYHTIWQSDVTISHDDKTGQGSLRMIWEFNGGGTSLYNTSSGVEYYYPPTIPRASTFEVNSTLLTADNLDSIIATINKKNSTFTDRLTMTFGSKSAEFTISNNSATIKVPESWASVIPNATSGTATLTLTTYNGNSVIGSSSKSITIKVKSYSPGLSITRVAPVSTPAVFSSVNYVQSLSKVRVRSSASGYQGSTITEQKVSILNKGYDGSDITSDFLNFSGTVQILVTCVDSRGKTNAVTQNITVVEYYPPTVSIETSSSQAEEKNTINVSTRISSVSGLNAKTYKLYGTWIDEGGTVHTDEQLASGNITNPDFTLYHNNIDPTVTYKYKVRIEDSIGYDVAEGITGVICISRYAGGRGVRFFGEAEQEGIDFNSKLSNMFSLNKSGVSKSLLDLIHPVGDLVFNSDEDFDPNVEWGGTWQRLNGVYPYSPKVNLTGTKWQFKDVIPRELFPDNYQEERYRVNITDSSGGNYTAIVLQGNQTPPTQHAVSLLYTDQWGDTSVYDDNYFSEQGWNQDRWKTITITGGNDVLSEGLYKFLLASAELIDGTIGYDYPLGSIIEAGLPNIEGTFDNYGEGSGTPAMVNSLSGCVYGVSSTSPGFSGSTGKDNDNYKLGIDASRNNSIYGNSDTVRPRSYTANAWLRIE